MQVISKNEVSNFLLMQTMYEQAKLREQLEVFQKKYGVSFEKFEEMQKESFEENFVEHDDYIDWKAAHYFYELNLQKLHDIQHGDIQFA